MKQNDPNHDVQSHIVYGPVSSRRFGTTLGINLLPAQDKICNFNCVYCQLGSNETFLSHHAFPTVEQIKNELLQLGPISVHAIVLSGNGEPTLYPYFTSACQMLGEFARTYDCALILLSNGQGFNHPKNLAALAYLDECCLKWDAAPELINLCHERPLQDAQLNVIKEQSSLVLQCCFAAGPGFNTEPQQLALWQADILRIQPARVDLYTLSRTPAKHDIKAISYEQLQNIETSLHQEGYFNTRIID